MENSSALRHVPEASADYLAQILREFPGRLIISKPRKSKLGDFRAKKLNGKYVFSISVNNDLNQYAFLITLIHELAHYHTFINHKKCAPHGPEWKNTFFGLMKPLLNISVFPSEVLKALKNYMNSPKASSCSDVNLYKSLANYDKLSHLVFISDLALGTEFFYNKKGPFRIKEKLRKRFKCQHLSTKRNYLFQPITKVSLTSSILH